MKSIFVLWGYKNKNKLNKGDMTAFIESGLRISALRNFVDRIKGLDPTDKELAVMAALVLFSLAYHDQTTPEDDCKLIERYQVSSSFSQFSHECPQEACPWKLWQFGFVRFQN